MSCLEFFCNLCCVRSWVFENKDAEDKERPFTKCLACNSKVLNAEQELRDAIETNLFETLDSVLANIN